MIQNLDSNSLARNAAKASFLVYLFVAFFGTTMPFQARVTDVDDIGSSSAVNQILFSALFLLSAFSLVPVRDRAVRLLRQEKFLSLLILWCLLSVLWSDFSFVAFKRLFQIITAVVVSLAVLLHFDLSHQIERFFKIVLGCYLLVSLISIAVIPGAIDPTHHTWRGIATTKNHLGQASAMCLIIWINMLIRAEARARLLPITMTLISAALLIGSSSMTAISALAILLGLSALFYSDRFFRPLRIGRVFSTLILSSSAALIFLVLLLSPQSLLSAPELVGKDITFTGRTDLWLDILAEAKNHLYLGAGFGSFWVMDNENLLRLYENYHWLPRQAHMGYLDMLNEIGLVGLMLFALLVVSYFRGLGRLNQTHLCKGIVLAVLLINFQETTLLKPKMLTGTLFIFSYLALQAELLRQRDTEASGGGGLQAKPV